MVPTFLFTVYLAVGGAVLFAGVLGSVYLTTLPRTELDPGCHRCGAPTAITYEEGWLYHVCTACDGEVTSDHVLTGTLFAEPFPAAALSNRTPEGVFAAVECATGLICPRPATLAHA